MPGRHWMGTLWVYGGGLMRAKTQKGENTKEVQYVNECVGGGEKEKARE